ELSGHGGHSALGVAKRRQFRLNGVPLMRVTAEGIALLLEGAQARAAFALEPRQRGPEPLVFEARPREFGLACREGRFGIGGPRLQRIDIRPRSLDRSARFRQGLLER